VRLTFKDKDIVFDYVMVDDDGSLVIHRAWFADNEGEPQSELSDSELITLNREKKDIIQALKGGNDVQH
jgi:hypothetical protein